MLVGGAWSEDPQAMLSEGFVGRSSRPGDLPTLIYDGQCSFCGRWVRRVQAWDRAARLSYLPLQDPAAAVLSGRPNEALGMAVHFVTPSGHVFAGATAVREMLAHLPGGSIPRAILRVPGAMSLAAKVYARVARKYGPVGNRPADDARC